MNYIFKLKPLAILISALFFLSCEKNEMPVPDFEFEDNMTTSLDIPFTNKSVHADSYHWDFGDGNTSTEKSPLHRYKYSSEYTVTLSATNAEGKQSISKTVTVWQNKVQVYNATSNESPSMFIAYTDGRQLWDRANVGVIQPGEYSKVFYVNRNLISQT